MKCTVCGNTILNPICDKDEILKMYNGEDYFSNSNQSKIIDIGYGSNYHKYNIGAMKNKKSHFYQRLKLIQRFKKSGSIFEIGCAHGYFLTFLKSYGYKVEGCDLNPGALKNAYDKSILTYNQPIEDINFTKKYDVICAFDVIEHIVDISNFIDIIKHLLNKSGIIFFSTPNFEEYYFFHFLNKRWSGIVSSLDHINYFTPKTIKYFFKKKGLKIKFMRTIKYDIHKKTLKMKLFYLSTILLGKGNLIEIVLKNK